MATILAPLDGSALAEAALPHIHSLAVSIPADIILLRVVTPHELARLRAEELVDAWDDTLPPREEFDRQIRELLHDEAESYLAAHAERLRAEGLNVETRVIDGLPAAVIVAQAEAIRPTLIVMASHGYSGLQRWALGSVTDRVVSASSIPVMVIRSAVKLPGVKIRHILTPLDGSALSAQALPLAVMLAQRTQAKLTLLRVIESPVIAEPYGSMQYLQIMEYSHTLAQRELAQTVAAVQAQQVPAQAIVATGHVAGLIVGTAASEQVDLIVMATHGYTGIQRWALGSVADKVLHASDTPLILVRSQATDR